MDRVALYLHFRSNWEKYPEYVSETKKLFPNAVIYGGVYHYDRIDYLKCKQGGKDKCSKNDEFRLYQDALNLQLGLLKSKLLAASSSTRDFLAPRTNGGAGRILRCAIKDANPNASRTAKSCRTTPCAL